MKTSRKRIAAGVALLALAAGAAIAQERPESILPPGFNDPVAPTPSPTPAPAQSGTPAPAAPVSGAPSAPPVSGLPTPTPTPSATPTPVDLSAYELPAYAKRSLAAVGAIGETSGGIPLAAYGTADGQMLERLMRRLDAPLPSRWLSITLRRALVSRTYTPVRVNGADFAAERAWLLLRMGEADAARAVVQSVDVENYTPKLFQVAMQAMLANGDPAGACPLVEPAMRVSDDAAWPFARAWCTALQGKGAAALPLLRAASRKTGRSIDALLAEKVVGAAAQNRAVTIEWDAVDRLTAWRLGLSVATGVEVPGELLAQGKPQVALWRATAPMIPPATRATLADAAAGRGVLSNLALVDLYSEVEATDDSGSATGAAARDLRTAFTAAPDERLRMLRQLWGSPSLAPASYGRLVLTARAAALIPPSPERRDDAGRLIASMLTAGLDRAAVRWSGSLDAGSDGWALLALADPRPRGVASGDVERFRGNDVSAGKLKSRMLLAGLTGLGRLSVEDAQQLAESFDVRFGLQNSWTRAIEAAAARREAGTVILLFAAGMQTGDWRGVPPEVLYHGVKALRSVGMGGEARMIAAEAVARL